MNDPIIIGCILVGASLLVLASMSRLRRHELVASRLSQDEPPEVGSAPVRTEPMRSWPAGWLYRAGYRSEWASAVYLAASGLCLLLGGAFVYFVNARGLVTQLSNFMTSIPGGVGNVMVPFAIGAPWLVMLVVTLIPTLVVRNRRRRRVQE
ncbi:MAG: hypothetical protein MI861_18540, partial [Pirellulales bacterium]|nr:hypothetical protein [Pirellulales bacterium]